MTSFSEIASAVRTLSEQGQTDAAALQLENAVAAYPRQVGLNYQMQAQLLAKAGRSAEAIARLDTALARGCRYKSDWLMNDQALASLHADASFRDVVARAQRAYDEAANAAKPHLKFAIPDSLPDAFGYPLLMVLHGNNSNATETLPHWGEMANRGWVVAVPQSDEIGASPDAYVWNDHAHVAEQLDLQFDRVKRATQVDTSRIVLAGFSMGATQALNLALKKRYTVRGVISIAAWMPQIEGFTTLVQGGAGKMVRFYVVVGGKDASSAGARAFVALLESHQIRAKLDERPGLGHDYPEDMDATLSDALEFVTK